MKKKFLPTVEIISAVHQLFSALLLGMSYCIYLPPWKWAGLYHLLWLENVSKSNMHSLQVEAV